MNIEELPPVLSTVPRKGVLKAVVPDSYPPKCSHSSDWTEAPKHMSAIHHVGDKTGIRKVWLRAKEESD